MKNNVIKAKATRLVFVLMLMPSINSCFLYYCLSTFLIALNYIEKLSQSCCHCILSHGIEKTAWDASGERLALSYKCGDEVYAGLIAVYDVRRTPLISLSLVLVPLSLG